MDISPNFRNLSGDWILGSYLNFKKNPRDGMCMSFGYYFFFCLFLFTVANVASFNKNRNACICWVFQ